MAAPPLKVVEHPQNGVAAYSLERPPGVGSTRGEDSLADRGHSVFFMILTRKIDVNSTGPQQVSMPMPASQRCRHTAIATSVGTATQLLLLRLLRIPG
jgi:hypothetical protein